MTVLVFSCSPLGITEDQSCLSSEAMHAKAGWLGITPGEMTTVQVGRLQAHCHVGLDSSPGTFFVLQTRVLCLHATAALTQLKTLQAGHQELPVTGCLQKSTWYHNLIPSLTFLLFPQNYLLPDCWLWEPACTPTSWNETLFSWTASGLRLSREFQRWDWEESTWPRNMPPCLQLALIHVLGAGRFEKDLSLSELPRDLLRGLVKRMSYY